MVLAVQLAIRLARVAAFRPRRYMIRLHFTEGFKDVLWILYLLVIRIGEQRLYTFPYLIWIVWFVCGSFHRFVGLKIVKFG